MVVADSVLVVVVVEIPVFPGGLRMNFEVVPHIPDKVDILVDHVRNLEVVVDTSSLLPSVLVQLASVVHDHLALALPPLVNSDVPF